MQKLQSYNHVRSFISVGLLSVFSLTYILALCSLMLSYSADVCMWLGWPQGIFDACAPVLLHPQFVGCLCLCKQIARMPYTFCIPNPFRYGKNRGGGGPSRELFRPFPYTTSVNSLSHGDHPRDGQRLTVVLNLRRKKIGFVRRLKRLTVWITGALDS